MKRSVEEKLLNPKPGSKIAVAKALGVDLNELIINLRLTPTQRLEKLQQQMYELEKLKNEKSDVKE